MTQTYIDQLAGKIGESVTLKGWLYNSRSSGKLVFLQLRDGPGTVQCVVFKGNDEALFDSAKGVGQESSIIVTGTVKEDARSAIGVELDVTGLEILQNVHDYPITPKEHGTEFLMDFPVSGNAPAQAIQNREFFQKLSITDDLWQKLLSTR